MTPEQFHQAMEVFVSLAHLVAFVGGMLGGMHR